MAGAVSLAPLAQLRAPVPTQASDSPYRSSFYTLSYEPELEIRSDNSDAGLRATSHFSSVKAASDTPPCKTRR
eukprot:1396049-Amphidinium_carterae.1